MHQDKTLLDLDFGLSQLSGNRELLVKLLDKFVAEYSDAHQKLCTMLQDSNQSNAKIMVHTIKGVAGNLGMNALHLYCKDLEQSILADAVDASQQDEFGSLLSSTFETIGALSSNNTEAQVESTTAEDPKADLLDALQKNEYIPADKLDAMLAGIQLDADSKSKVSDAINDLDYAAALNILNA